MKMATELYSVLERMARARPPLHHFCSSSSENEGSYLRERWEECLNQGNLHLPIRKMKVYNTDGYLAYTEYYSVQR